MSFRLEPQVRLRTRPEFVQVQEDGRRAAMPTMIVLARTNGQDRDRLGLIASRKFGGAVSRNRAKRRVRAAFRAMQPDTVGARGLAGHDIVVIPRREILAAPFPQITSQLAAALSRLDRTRRT
jgi:ribonuclease P protein component